MKKLLTLLTFLLIIGVSAKANYLTITNTTGCDYIVMTANDQVMHLIQPIWMTSGPVTFILASI